MLSVGTNVHRDKWDRDMWGRDIWGRDMWDRDLCPRTEWRAFSNKKGEEKLRVGLYENPLLGSNNLSTKIERIFL